jgi:hypothetical protein
MAGRDECHGCGTTVPRDARRCLRCGRVDPTVDVELERLDLLTPVPPTVSSQRAVVGNDGPGGRGRTLAAAAAVVVVLAAAALVLSGPGGGGDAESADDAAGTSVPSTIEPPTTGSTSRPTSTTRPPTTTSTTTTMISYPAGAGQPLLRERTGLSLYAARGATLYRFELDNGTLTALPLPHALANSVRTLEREGDRLLIDTGHSSMHETGFDLRGGVVPSPRTNSGGQPLVGTTIRWSAASSGAGVETVRFWDSGDVPPLVIEHVLPSGSFTVGSVGTRVVVHGGGRLYTLDVQGTIRPYAHGAAGGSGGAWLLWTSCDDRLRCRLHLGDEADPDVRDVTAPASWPFGGRGWGSVAPDGGTAVLAGAEGPVLVDLATGAVLDDGFSWDSYVWSDESNWLFRVGRDLDVEAVSTRDGRVVDLFRPATDGQNEYVVLEIG